VDTPVVDVSMKTHNHQYWQILSASELDRCQISEEIEDVAWMPKGNRFLKIETPELMAYLKDKIEKSGKILFDGAADGMDYLREVNNAEH
jgi:hypothetical protein